MQFGEDKRAFLQIEKGKVMHNLKPISINGLTIKPIEEGDNHKYLGIDGSISYNGPINEERVPKEYIIRIRKIWNSQLSGFNKAAAHNAFAVPTTTSTLGILDWTCKEIYTKLEKPLQFQVVFIPTVMLIGYTSVEKMEEEV